MPASRAFRASIGPASASASTLTMTIDLPVSQALRTWRMPAGGSPVESITRSTGSSRNAASTSSAIQVPPERSAVTKSGAAYRSSGQPIRARFRRAASGFRSAMTATWMPGVRIAWARNIEANLPQPRIATRTGLSSACRAPSSR